MTSRKWKRGEGEILELLSQQERRKQALEKTDKKLLEPAPAREARAWRASCTTTTSQSLLHGLLSSHWDRPTTHSLGEIFHERCMIDAAGQAYVHVIIFCPAHISLSLFPCYKLKWFQACDAKTNAAYLYKAFFFQGTDLKRLEIFKLKNWSHPFSREEQQQWTVFNTSALGLYGLCGCEGAFMTLSLHTVQRAQRSPGPFCVDSPQILMDTPPLAAMPQSHFERDVARPHFLLMPGLK